MRLRISKGPSEEEGAAGRAGGKGQEELGTSVDEVQNGSVSLRARGKGISRWLKESVMRKRTSNAWRAAPVLLNGGRKVGEARLTTG